jgi:hypothetical protein
MDWTGLDWTGLEEYRLIVLIIIELSDIEKQVK